MRLAFLFLAIVGWAPLAGAQPLPVAPCEPWFFPSCPGPAIEMRFYAGPALMPPLVISADTLYGPAAAGQFFHVPQGRPAARAQAEPREEKRRATSNLQAIALARRFVMFGDAKFAEQKYDEAIGRYRKAIAAAPDQGEGWFRLGWGLLATGRHEQAAKAFKQGLTCDPGWKNSGFALTSLYGENRLAQTAHLEALAAAAAADPPNGNLLFLVGLAIYFDCQPERALPFFRRAAQLLAEDKNHVQAFLKR